jgi:hypothetical protein
MYSPNLYARQWDVLTYTWLEYEARPLSIKDRLPQVCRLALRDKSTLTVYAQLGQEGSKAKQVCAGGEKEVWEVCAQPMSGLDAHIYYTYGHLHM